MHVCVYICIHAWLSISLAAPACLSVCLSLSVALSVCVCVCLSLCISVDIVSYLCHNHDDLFQDRRWKCEQIEERIHQLSTKRSDTNLIQQPSQLTKQWDLNTESTHPRMEVPNQMANFFRGKHICGSSVNQVFMNHSVLLKDRRYR